MWRIRSPRGPVCWRREVGLARPVSSQPTEVELQILRILWQTGGATARQVHNGLAADEAKSTNYSTPSRCSRSCSTKGSSNATRARRRRSSARRQPGENAAAHAPRPG